MRAENGLVTITEEEYEKLIYQANFLSCLEVCGVDNWVGYGDAWEMTEGDE